MKKLMATIDLDADGIVSPEEEQKALELLKDRNNPIERIYLSKPNVEVGEKLGYLPGTVEDIQGRPGRGACILRRK